MSDSNGVLSAESVAEADEVMARYPVKRASILMLFHIVQREHGYISAEAEEWIAERLEMHPVKVHEVLTFYTMLHPDPVGTFHLQVCRTLSCQLRGCDELLDHLRSEYGLTSGEVAGDGVFSVDEVECLGACGDAPVVQVDDDYVNKLTVESFEELLQKLRAEAEAKGSSSKGAN